VLYVSCEVCQLVLAEFVESVEEEKTGERSRGGTRLEDVMVKAMLWMRQWY
jgi:hypothetical protein